MDYQAPGKGAVSLNGRSTRGVQVPGVQKENSISDYEKLVRNEGPQCSRWVGFFGTLGLLLSPDWSNRALR